MANKLVSILPSGTNNYLTPSLSFNRLQTDILTPSVVGTITNTSGVSPATGSFAVNAQGTPNMTVAVSAGQAYVAATPSGGTAQNFGVTSDASENVTIPANSTGSTRYDFIYLQLDTTKLNNPAVNGLDVASFVVSRSTTAYDSTNTTTYGNSNGAQPGLLLAVVTVANAAASIANSVITDARQQGLIGNNVLRPSAVQASHLATGSVTGDKLSSTALKLGKTIVTAVATFTTVETTIASVTVTVPAGGRDVRLTLILPQVVSTVAGDRVISRFKESSTVLQTFYTGIPSQGTTPHFSAVVSAPSAGAHTYTFTCARDTGSGTIQIYADAAGANIILLAEAI